MSDYDLSHKSSCIRARLLTVPSSWAAVLPAPTTQLRSSGFALSPGCKPRVIGPSQSHGAA